MPEMRSEKELAIGGFRDFYPELYQKINYILKIFRAVPRLYGYLEYETPTVEPMKLYQLKSGEELVEETFKVTDRKERHLVLRPEITPSLARMLAARQQFYSRPIRWFCVSRVFRDETPQRGRVKEHWQLNVDILGIEDVAADAEIIDILVMIIKSIGFTSSDFVIRINDRRFVQSYIESLGLTNYLEVIRVLDRRDKLLQEELERKLETLNYSTEKATEIALILRRIAAGNQDAKKELPKRKEVHKLSKNLSQIQNEATLKALQAANVPKSQAKKLSEFALIRGAPAAFLQTIDSLSLDKKVTKTLRPLRQLARQLKDLDIEEYCEFNAGIARGLDYYTGIVFEAWDKGAGLPRAIAGGGRYDDLVSIFKDQRLPGTGFGFGETVILTLAEEKGLIPPQTPAATIYIAPVSEEQISISRKIAAKLRDAGIQTIFNGYPWSLTKHLEVAGKRQIPFTAIIGPRELAQKAVNLRDMATGDEKLVKIDDLPHSISPQITSGKK